MKSIKQQYIDLQEGKMSQANFMRSLRMTMPQYVTNVTSYNDSVRILKNKGILSEADMNMGKEIRTTSAEEVAMQAGNYIDAVDALESMGLKHDEANRIATEMYGEEDMPEKKYNDEDNAREAERVNMMIDQGIEDRFDESLNEAQAIKGNNSKDLYTHFKEIDNLNGQEVLIGIDFEIEKNPELTKAAAAKIVVKNLKKNPIYYTSSLMAGKEGYEPQYMNKFKPGADQMQELGKDNAIDKENGMKPVKDVEKIKASANKAKKETNTAEKGISLMSLIAKSVRGVQKMNATGEKMKKIVMKEGMEGQYTFNGYFKGGELDKLKTMIPDAEIDDQVEYSQGAKTTVLSQQHSDEEIKKAVDSVIGMNEDKVASTIFDKNANITKGVNDIAKGKLTKERLKELIRQEIAGAYGGDSMDPEDGSSYTND
jgi:hypothetical protein